MKLLIAGSRGIKDFGLEEYVPPDTDCIISGGADGVDTLAEAYADANGISKVIVRPQYDRYGRAAPIRRNEEMVDMADSVLVIWDGVSRDSRHTINYAKKKNKPVVVVTL